MSRLTETLYSKMAAGLQWAIDNTEIIKFLEESNKIEGIYHVSAAEVDVAKWFLELPKIKVADVAAYVSVTQPNAVIRDGVGMDVRVGRYIAPPGGPDIPKKLEVLLRTISLGSRDGVPFTPYEGHVRYEALHPFLDGNGRSGRLVWLWHMRKQGRRMAPMGFLQSFYYQALDASGR